MDFIYRNPHYHRNPNASLAYVLAHPEEALKNGPSRGAQAPYYQVQQQKQLQQLLHQKFQEQLQQEQRNNQQLQKQLQIREQANQRLQQQQQQQQQQSLCTNQNQQPNALTTNSFDVVEEEGRFLMYTDLPGCKVDDVKVALLPTGVLQIEGERKRGKHPKHFHRKFAVDDRMVDPEQITATLFDGTLEISAPKKQVTEPRKLPVSVAIPPPEESAFELEVDLPGVNVENLAIVLKQDKLYVLGHRTRGGERKEFQQAFPVDSRTVETSNMVCYLEDGVLTICAPRRAPIVPRTISINGKQSTPQVDATEVPEKTTAVNQTTENATSSSQSTTIPLEALLQLLYGASIENLKETDEATVQASNKKETADDVSTVEKNVIAAQADQPNKEELPMSMQGALEALHEALAEAAAEKDKGIPTKKEKKSDLDNDISHPREPVENRLSNPKQGAVTLHRLTPMELMMMFPGMFQEGQEEEEEEKKNEDTKDNNTPPLSANADEPLSAKEPKEADLIAPPKKQEEVQKEQDPLKDASVAATMDDESDIPELEESLEKQVKEETSQQLQPFAWQATNTSEKNDPSPGENREPIGSANLNEAQNNSTTTSSSGSRTSPEPDYHIVPETVSEEDDE